ncbi:hypothetical protein [Emticicia sp. BO119]|uniref:hypothetical protein n=1 Tax=Emticicia sp. BO119 TaxID=2757768 RepID=UPI0015F01A82|nr:hypothetical protein [Emticicia sp. BO119]MBA4849233.1 hypothetical protein [Emticicia sp. BO119]
MANELFDKKIKEKLESVQRPVGPNTWDNIRKRIYAPWYFDFWRKYGLPLYSTIATVLLLVNLKDKFNYEKQFRLLNEKISTIQQLKPAKQVQTIVHKDTIYINKTIYIIQRTEEKPEGPLASAQETMPLVEKSVEQSVVVSNQVKPEEILPANDQQLVKEATMEEKTNSDFPKKDSADKINKLKIPTKTIQQSPSKKTLKWPRIDTRLGLSAGHGFNHTVDLGPSFELFFGKNLSFNTGVSIFSHPESEYYNPKEFNIKTSADFADLYKPHLPPKYDQIEDIHIKASLITIPLNMNYYLPINKRFDVKFLLGTSIDLKLYQNVKFESHLDGDEHYSSFDTEQKKGAWNSMTFGSGLQYRLKRYAFQLTPTYIYHFKETDFLSPKTNFRVSGGVLINLKRDK